MDKSWMQLRNRWSDEYIQGVKVFLESSTTCIDKANRMRCPCRDCNNVHFRTIDVVEKHLLMRGMDQQYTRWIHHGEEPAPVIHSYDVIDDEIEDNVDEMQEILEDIHRGTNANNFSDASPGTNSDRPTGMDKFSKLLADAKSSLYPGCEKFSKLSFIVKLMHIKTISRWSNKSFDMLLELLKEVFPPENKVPKSHYDSKIMIRDLGLGYEIIHACKNNCILFRKEYAAATHCPKCGESRYINKQSNDKKNIAQKVLRYFDIKPRFQRLFMSRKIAGDMCWHKDKRVIEENVLRHPLHPHKSVKQDKWEEICKRFSSPDFQKKSLINSQNRAKLVINHVGGSRSFVQHRYKKKLGRIALYKDTHFRELTSEWSSPEAEAKYIEMQQMQSEVGNEHLTQDEIVDKVLGVAPGYVRGLGHGVKGPSIRGKNNTTAELEITRLELEDSQKEVSTLKEKQAEMNAKQTEMDEKQARMEAELVENKARLDALLAAFNSGRP